MTQDTTKSATETLVTSGIEPGALDRETQRKVEEYIEQEEGAANRLSGWTGHMITALAVIMTLFHLYAAYDIVPTQTLRPVHVGFVMLLIFLLYPVALRFRDRIRWWDVITALIGIATMAYLVMGGDDLTDRASLPNQTDMMVGAVFIVLILKPRGAPPGRSCRWSASCSSPMRCSGPICRRPGRIAATMPSAWSAIST
jgi:hypothetical protein